MYCNMEFQYILIEVLLNPTVSSSMKNVKRKKTPQKHKKSYGGSVQRHGYLCCFRGSGRYECIRVLSYNIVVNMLVSDNVY